MLNLIPLAGVPMVQPGDDLAAIVIRAFEENAVAPAPGDVLVVAQKVVSKAESRYVDLADVIPSEEAYALAAELDKDPRLIAVILSESRRVVRRRPGLLIAEHRLGFVMANAGVDRSNLEPHGNAERVLLLPRDPDASAGALHGRLRAHFGVAPETPLGVIVNDSFGRPWRKGTAGVALGAAGLPVLLDLRGRPDLYGRHLEVTISAFADEIAAAASLVMGQADEARPLVLVRGLEWTAPPSPATDLVRTAEEDLFR